MQDSGNARVHALATLTGERISPPMQPSGFSFTTELGATGSGSVTLPLSEITENSSVFDGPAVTLVVTDRAGGIRGAGIVRDWRQDGEQVTFNIAEFGMLHELRALNGVGASAPATRAYRGASLSDVVVQVLRTMYHYQGIGKSAWDLPIIWPALNTNGQVVRRFEWWRFLTGQQALDELAAETGSPVIHFEPVFKDDLFRWRCRVGDLGHATHALAVGLPDKPVQGAAQITYARDFKAMRTEMFITGNGQEAKIVWGSASTSRAPAGTPRMVSVSAWGTVEDRGRCNEIGRGLLGARADSVERWEITVNASGAYVPSQFKPGDRVEIQHPGDWLHPAGVYQRIILAVQHDTGDQVRLTVQEVATQADRLQSGIGSVLRRLSTAETQASNRSSTTIDEITGMVQRAERATANAQKAADEAKARADAARREAEEARKRADAAKKSADSAGASARAARSRADSAYSSAQSAGSSASAARSAASDARAAANRAQNTAVSASQLATKSWALNLQIVAQTNRLLAKQFPNNPPVIQP